MKVSGEKKLSLAVQGSKFPRSSRSNLFNIIISLHVSGKVLARKEPNESLSCCSTSDISVSNLE